MQQVHTFIEKPDVIQGLAAVADGVLLNTLVMAVKVETLWSLGWPYLPELMERLYSSLIGTRH